MNPTTITLDLDLDAYLRRHTGWAGDGDVEVSEPMTIEDVVLDLAAQQVHRAAVAQAMKEDFRSLRDRVANIRDEEIRARVAPLIEEAMRAPVVRTNAFGETIGASTTMREQIMQAATDYLTKPGGGAYDRNKGTPVQQFIATEVAAAVKAELTDALAKARAEVGDAVRSNAAALIEQTIANVVGIKR